MLWQPIPRHRLATKQPLGKDELHVWWWPEPLQPNTATRRLRTDAILRTLLARYLALEPDALRFGRESKGRPFLDHPDSPDFNLSDTAGGTVLAVAGAGRVGIDIERTDRTPPVVRLAARWYAPEEAEALRQMDAESARIAFLRHWTAKEAACKATGTGIFGYLSAWHFGIDADPLPPRLLRPPADAGQANRWTLHRLAPTASHTVALTCRDMAASPQGFAVAH